MIHIECLLSSGRIKGHRHAKKGRLYDSIYVLRCYTMALYFGAVYNQLAFRNTIELMKYDMHGTTGDQVERPIKKRGNQSTSVQCVLSSYLCSKGKAKLILSGGQSGNWQVKKEVSWDGCLSPSPHLKNRSTDQSSRLHPKHNGSAD